MKLWELIEKLEACKRVADGNPEVFLFSGPAYEAGETDIVIQINDVNLEQNEVYIEGGEVRV